MVAGGEKLSLRGGGRCQDFGRPVRTDAMLDLAALSGVLVYEPAELVVTARAATPLAQIKELLARHRQYLAFEPPDLGPLWGQDVGSGTIGGCLMLGLGGSRRASAGAPRDHFLGLKGVNGHAQQFAAGGRVVKNVTGFDLPKLFAGSLGTLGVVTEVTLKVMPMPERTLTLAVPGLSAAQAIQLLTKAASGPAQSTGGAFLAENLAARSALPALSSAKRSFVLLRLEGFAPSVEWGAQFLLDVVREHSLEPPLRIGNEESQTLWNEISSVAYFAPEARSEASATAAAGPSDASSATAAAGTEPSSQIWRISVEPSSCAAVVGSIESRTGAACFFDCFGGVIWVQIPVAPDAVESVVRGALLQGGRIVGHATLVRASAEVRERIAPFQPLEAALAALTRRVKQRFDPLGIFNPGRMYEGV
jgi:glycolate oxidase FAD binding subunit